MGAVFVLLSTVDALRTGVAFGAALVFAATGLAMLLYVRARDFIRSNRTVVRETTPRLLRIVTPFVAVFFTVIVTIYAGAKHSSVAMFPWLPPLYPVPVVGPSSPSGEVVALDLLPGESVGPIVCPMNFTYGGDLAFFGVSPVSTGVWFGVSGAFAAVSPDGRFDLWTCGDLAEILARRMQCGSTRS